MMNDPKQHLTEDLILGYSAGTLPEAVNLIVATHISMCDACRAAMEAADAVGGSLLETCDTVTMSDDALSGALDLIRNGTAQAQPAAVEPRDPVLPDPLRAYVGGSLEQVKWRPVGMGVKQAIVPMEDTSATARLLYIPAGTAIPDHGHRGMELTLVLQGAFSDEDGRFARGDIEIAFEDLDHTPVADMSEDCICLAVTDAPLKFRGLLPRLAQPFLGI